MTWLCRSMDQSLRARQLRNACSAGIILDPGIWLLWANWSNFRRTRSGTNKNRPPQRVVNVRGARPEFRSDPFQNRASLIEHSGHDEMPDKNASSGESVLTDNQIADLPMHCDYRLSRSFGVVLRFHVHFAPAG